MATSDYRGSVDKVEAGPIGVWESLRTFACNFISFSVSSSFGRGNFLSRWIVDLDRRRAETLFRDPSDDASTATKMRRGRCVAVTRTFHSTKKRASPGDTNARL